MKDEVKNFREVTDLMLKDIYVTDELKRKTLAKCVEKKSVIVNWRVLGTFSFSLILFFMIFINLFQNPTIIDEQMAKFINNEEKIVLDEENKMKEIEEVTNDADFENTISSSSKEQDNMKNKVLPPNKKDANAVMKSSHENSTAVNQKTGTFSQSTDNTGKDNNSIIQDKADIVRSNSENNKEIGANTSLALAPEPLTIEKAEEFFQSKIKVPSYIPDGFKFVKIYIPDDNVKCVKLKYSSESAWFEISQSKEFSKLSEAQHIFIGNILAYVSFLKDANENITITTITWIRDNIQYSISGDLPEDLMIKIAESINL